MASSSISILRLSFVGALALGGAFALGQSAPASQGVGTNAGSAPAKAPVDLSWLHEFVGPYSGKDIKWDPRFQTLIRSSLHQRQSIWRDHGKLISLPDLVQVFIGMPGSVLVDEDRFYTIEGCVPHDCTDRGMVWIDSASTDKMAVIFVAMSSVNTAMDDHATPIHLWLFSSTALNWQKLPPNFLLRLSQWWLETQSHSNSDFDARLAMVTIVQPDSETVDLTPALLASVKGGGTK